MSGSTTADTPSVLQRQPALAAGGITAVVAAILAAFWSITSDAAMFPWLSSGSQGLITTAILASVALLAGWWAQRRSTAISAPKLPEGSRVELYSPGGATSAHVSMPSVAEINAAHQ